MKIRMGKKKWRLLLIVALAFTALITLVVALDLGRAIKMVVREGLHVSE
jgi:hypothetical protein